MSTGRLQTQYSLSNLCWILSHVVGRKYFFFPKVSHLLPFGEEGETPFNIPFQAQRHGPEPLSRDYVLHTVMRQVVNCCD